MTDKFECNVLVCGSQRFQEQSFVFKVLTNFYEHFPQMNNVIVSKTSGACQFAETWVAFMNEILIGNELPTIGIRYFSYDSELEKKNSSLYENFAIPDFVMQTDPFFTKGKDEILRHDIKAVLAFPNPEGKLGSSTINIQRFVKMAGREDMFFDCSDLRTLLLAKHNTHTNGNYNNLDDVHKDAMATPAKEVTVQEEAAFGNLRPSKIKPR